jgi:hypothetical protein
LQTLTMKNRNRILLGLRMAAASTFLLAAAGLAFVGVTTSGVLTNNNPSTNAFAKQHFSGVKQEATYGFEARAEKALKDPAGAVEGALPDFGPDTAAIEENFKRSYPGDFEIPPSLAQQAFADSRSFYNAALNPPAPATPTPSPVGKGKKGGKGGKKGTIVAATPTPAELTPPTFPAWQEVGPSTATFPAILTFSGASYVTSGRITALAIDPNCNVVTCRLWLGAAGGGVWRTTNALDSVPSWSFISGSLQSNAIGAITYDAAHGALYVGTGEPNASGDSASGAGVWRSLDGGNTWTSLPAQVGPISTFSPGTASNGTYTGNAFVGRSIGSVVIDPTNPSIMYVSTARGVRGIASVTGGSTSNPTPPRPPFGLFKSTNGGASFKFIWDGGSTCPLACNGTSSDASLRGVTDVRLDPNNHNIVYAATYPSPNTSGGGIWRSTDGGTTWTQIHSASNAADNSDRAAFDVVNIGSGATRMYAQIGNAGSPVSHVFRSDNVNTAATFTDLTAAEAPAGQSSNVCTGQCWYDSFVVASPDYPNLVYVGGSFNYGEYGGKSDGRGVILSIDSGASWTDVTWDATTGATPVGSCCQPNPIAPNGIHPDQHALAIAPVSLGYGAGLFFEGSDGGLMRSSGLYTSIASQCAIRVADGALNPADVPLCQQLLSRVPTQLFSLNQGLATLQFQSVSVDSGNVNHLQGGTQDNGTFDNNGGSLSWLQEIYGDGGQSGFNRNNSNLRFNTFTGQANDANFQNGAPTKWVEISGPILYSQESALFYPPVIADPTTAFAGSIFQGSRHVWRTQDWGGTQATLEANCPEFGPYSPFCGDFEPLGGGSALNCYYFVGGACLNISGDLGGTYYGTDRRPTSASRLVTSIARTASNTNTAWASTAGGRLFISDNINDPTPANVVWSRLDSDGAAMPTFAAKSPSRFISSIYIDPNNVHHAWVAYSGYKFNTPTTPGHVFSVTWSGSGLATWTDISTNLPEMPVNSIVRDDVTGDLYAATDFMVLRLPSGSSQWTVSGTGMPFVVISGLTVVPNSRVLYAATHGRSVWKLNLP